MVGAILGGFTILGALLTFAAWINGRSTKRFVKELMDGLSEHLTEHLDAISERHEKLLVKMDERAEQRHQEVVGQFQKMDERAEQGHQEVVGQFQKMDERAEQRHQEVIELLKMGFGGK